MAGVRFPAEALWILFMGNMTKQLDSPERYNRTKTVFLCGNDGFTPIWEWVPRDLYNYERTVYRKIHAV